VQGRLVPGELGGHPAGFGPSAGRRVDQDGFSDPGELAEELADGHFQSVLAGAVPHQVSELQGQDAGEDVHPDVVPGPVVHRGERHDAGVFHLPEGEFGFGLGPVPGDHVRDGPFVVVSDQDMLAEDLLLQGGAGVRVDLPGQPQVLGLLAGQFPGDDAADPGLGGDRLDLGGDFLAGPARLAAGQGGGQLVQLRAGLGQGGAVEAEGLAVVQFRGVGQDRAAPGAVDLAAGVVSGQPAEPVFIDQGAVGCGQASKSGQSLAGTDPT
jgi:hypothetical protein